MSCRGKGFTLAEMLVTCAVLAIAAAVALPSSQPAVEVRTGAAVDEVVRALRFAREEAMRTGALRMVACDTAKNTVSVYVPDSGGNVSSSVNDPLTKMNYTVALDQAGAGASAALRTCSFVFADGSQATTLAFDNSGNPVRGTAVVTGPAPPKGTAPTTNPASLLNSGTIQLFLGRLTRTVAVDVTGRVTAS